jgi:hypothetical protein
MLSIRKWANFLPAGKDFTIPARFFLPVGKGLKGSPAKVTKCQDGQGRRTQPWLGRYTTTWIVSGGVARQMGNSTLLYGVAFAWPSNAGAVIGGAVFGVREIAPAFCSRGLVAALRKTGFALGSPSGHFPMSCRGRGASTPTSAVIDAPPALRRKWSLQKKTHL